MSRSFVDSLRRAPSGALSALSALSALCVLVVLLGTTEARAQDAGFNAEGFEPAPIQEGSVLSVHGTRTLAGGTYSLTIFGSYARHPVAIEDAATGETVGQLMGSIGTLSVMGGFGLSDRVDVGLAVPLHRVSAGTSFDVAPAAVDGAVVDANQLALGDVRVVPRLTLLKREGDAGWGVAFLVPVSLPTGDDELYVGEGVRVEPRAALDWAVGPVLLAANVGYLIREERSVLSNSIDDKLRWGLGADLRATRHVSVLLETFGAMHANGGGLVRQDMPMEALAGVRYRRRGWLAQIGGGPGLVRGVTAPQYRMFASIGFTPEPQPIIETDSDGDGIEDLRDRCPTEPEDMDGFQDADGCPDLDNDGDGVADADDRCPTEPEDLDGFQDEDGCPDPDNDGDGVADADDRCPDEAGLSEHAGCLAPAQPLEAEAETQPETQAVELNELVHFDLGSSTLRSEAFTLMDELARLLKEHPEVLVVSVEGHADDRGSPALNTELSQRRADAVRNALIERGIDPARLRAKGFGSTMPVAPNDTEANRALNRRVQLRIYERSDGKPNVDARDDSAPREL